MSCYLINRFHNYSLSTWQIDLVIIKRPSGGGVELKYLTSCVLIAKGTLSYTVGINSAADVIAVHLSVQDCFYLGQRTSLGIIQMFSKLECVPPRTFSQALRCERHPGAKNHFALTKIHLADAFP